MMVFPKPVNCDPQPTSSSIQLLSLPTLLHYIQTFNVQNIIEKKYSFLSRIFFLSSHNIYKQYKRKVNVRKSHLKKSYLVGLPEVGLPDLISHQEVPPQLLCILCTIFAFLDSFVVTSFNKKCLEGSMIS